MTHGIATDSQQVAAIEVSAGTAPVLLYPRAVMGYETHDGDRVAEFSGASRDRGSIAYYLRAVREPVIEPRRRLPSHASLRLAAAAGCYLVTMSEVLPGALAHYQRSPLAEAFAAINEMASLSPGWDTYDAPVPSAGSRAAATLALERLLHRNVIPLRVLPSAEGGVTVCLAADPTHYADIEFLNTGDVLAVTSDRRGEPTVWTVGIESSLDDTTDRILAFLGK